MGFYLGWRRQQISTLRWDQVDLDRKTIRAVPDKGGTPATLPLPEAVEDVLTFAATVRIVGEPHVFLVKDRTTGRWKPLSERDWRHPWLTAWRKIGRPAKRFHALRRSFISTAIEAGVPEHEVVRFTGHRTRATFQRYQIANPERLRPALDAFQRRLGEESTDLPIASVVAIR